jgi:hypothetical protein
MDARPSKRQKEDLAASGRGPFEIQLVREVGRPSAKPSANNLRFRQPQRDIPGRLNLADLRQPDLSGRHQTKAGCMACRRSSRQEAASAGPPCRLCARRFSRALEAARRYACTDAFHVARFWCLRRRNQTWRLLRALRISIISRSACRWRAHLPEGDCTSITARRSPTADIAASVGRPEWRAGMRA